MSVCPQCNAVVHVKRSVCGCGHASASKKRKVRCTAVGELAGIPLLAHSLTVKLSSLAGRIAACLWVFQTVQLATRSGLIQYNLSSKHKACTEGSALQCCSFYCV